MKKILFIWDFHGTLEKDNVKAVQEIVNKTFKTFGKAREISLEKTIELYGLSWIDYFRSAYPEGTLEQWIQMKDKAIAIQKQEGIVQKYIKPMNFAAKVLGTIKVKRHINIILSNTAPDSLRFFTKLVELDVFFDDYLSLDAHDSPRIDTDIQKMKANSLKEYLKDKSFSKLIKIGDRESDIEAGQAVGAITYFFRNEFNKNFKLNIKPDYEITDLRDILREL